MGGAITTVGIGTVEVRVVITVVVEEEEEGMGEGGTTTTTIRIKVRTRTMVVLKVVLLVAIMVPRTTMRVLLVVVEDMGIAIGEVEAILLPTGPRRIPVMAVDMDKAQGAVVEVGVEDTGPREDAEDMAVISIRPRLRTARTSRMETRLRTQVGTADMGVMAEHQPLHLLKTMAVTVAMMAEEEGEDILRMVVVATPQMEEGTSLVVMEAGVVLLEDVAGAGRSVLSIHCDFT